MPGTGPQPASQEASLAPTRVRCPRCDAPIGGDYKFCPSCAYRLRTSGDDKAETAKPPRSTWRTWFLVAAVSTVILASALVGILLFHPTLFQAAAPDVVATGPPVLASLAEPAIRVDDIPDDLVELPPGHAYEVLLEAVPGLDEPMPDGGETVREHWRRELAPAFPDGQPRLKAFIGYPLRVLRYEVTRGQYAEFLRDIEEHHDRIPKVWTESRRAARPEAPRLWAHVPDPWIRRNEDGDETSWDLPSAERNLPVANVSYVDALGFCEWASARLSLELRIPFAMEWVRAARGGYLGYIWPWGQRQLIYACNNRAWSNRPQYVHYVYSEPLPDGGRTPEGLFAMAGNVREYALDHDLELRPQSLPGAPPLLTWRQKLETPENVWAFGGSFRAGIDDCTVESRRVYTKWDRSKDDVGFRIVTSAPPR